jgi:hypothetical protein
MLLALHLLTLERKSRLREESWSSKSQTVSTRLNKISKKFNTLQYMNIDSTCTPRDFFWGGGYV